MTARVLVVDDVPANVKLLEARLSAEYFDVLTAMSGKEALAICERAECDIVLLDVMMPDMDGFEVCRRLKAGLTTHHIPVVMVTALDQPSDRLRGLEAGADDFLTKPVSDVALVARVRSLSRLKLMTDELRMRAVTSRDIGIESPEREAIAEAGRQGRILLVDDRASSYEPIAEMLASEHTAEVESDPNAGLFHAAEGNFDLVIVSLGLEGFDALRLCSQIRSLDRTRNVPILAIADAENSARLVRGLEIGVNDYLSRPVDKNELLARVRTQIRKKRYTERLRDNVQLSIEMAITDALTGLYNRRYMETHVGTLVEQASSRGKPLTVLVLDIDYFKSIMTAMATMRAMTCCASSRSASASRSAGSTWPAATAGRSSWCSCRRPISPLRPWWRSACGGGSQASRSPSSRAGAASRSPSRSGLLRSATATPPLACSSAPIRRSIGPSAMAVTGWYRTPPERLARGRGIVQLCK
jgi:two-component system cell cycle response regulator